MSLSSGLCKEYFKIEDSYAKEYNRDKLCVLYAIGSFYDMLEYINVDIECKLTKVASLLNVIVGGKKNNEKDLPNFIGFPKLAISKYLPVLIENGYTVVLVDENKHEGKIKRQVSGVYSSSIYPMHIIDNNKDCELLNITIEIYKDIKTSQYDIIYNIAIMNTFTNLFHMYNTVYSKDKSKNLECVLDDIYRIKSRYNITEYIINIYDNTNTTDINLKNEKVINWLDLDLNNVSVYVKYIDKQKYKQLTKLEYVEEFLKSIYKHITFGVISILDYLNLHTDDTIRLNCVMLLQFVSRHDIKYIENINIPTIINEYNHLVLELNTLQQLNIVPDNKNKNKFSCLFNVLNKTSTILGKRALLNLLSKPFLKHEDIQHRYILSEDFDKNCDVMIYDRLMDGFGDIERLYRKMSIGVMHQYEFSNLDKSFKKLLEINSQLKDDNCILILDTDIEDKLRNIVEFYNDIFIVDNLKCMSLNESVNGCITSPFKRGVIDSIDKLYDNITRYEDELESIRNNYESLIGGNGEWIKLTYTDNEGFYFVCTKIRLKILQKKLGEDYYSKLDIKPNSCSCRISSESIKTISNKLINTKILLLKKMKNEYLNITNDIAGKLLNIFNDIVYFIETVDIIKSNIKCKRLYKYTLPELINGDSMIIAEAMRHPIIERINDDFEYIPNDIRLDTDNSGIVLYALNSCGKSSLLRSIGLNLVMAQCGLYVPCDSFKFVPFESIITQVDLYDNLWKSQSSFISEMIGLKKIISLSNSKCLVLSDELTKGTEVVSATSIFASTVLSLVEKGCKFVFTTHLQDVSKLDIIKESTKLRICHLSVDFKENGDIIFERKLKDGPCSELYGLEVAKAVGIDKVLLDRAFTIRNILLNNTNTTKSKYSKYNSKKIVNKCELCNYSPYSNNDIPLDIHHINFQCNADTDGFNGHFHKNSKFNLVCLCKGCHIDVHNKKIVINGYKQSTSGKFLDFSDFR